MKRKIPVIFILIGLIFIMIPSFNFFLHQFKRETIFRQEQVKTKKSRSTVIKHIRMINKEAFVHDPFSNSRSSNSTDFKLACGKIIIPKIKVREPLFLDATYPHLKQGPSIILGTSIPGSGDNHNTVIAGHCYWWGMFLLISKLKPGDLIYIEFYGQRYVYEVRKQEVILPTDIQRLKPETKREELTLVTCYPFPTSLRRLLVRSNRTNFHDVERNKHYFENIHDYHKKKNYEGPISQLGFLLSSILLVIEITMMVHFYRKL